MSIEKRIFLLILLLGCVLYAGAMGYSIFEGWAFLDGLYMTVITIATVGFMEVKPLSSAGRIFTMFLILGGTGLLLYAASTVVSFVVEGELMGILGRRKMDKRLSKLKDHYIVCGAGATGIYVIEELMITRTQFVVITADIERLKKIDAFEKIVYIQGDATDDAVLREAGVEKARGLISVLPEDKDNLFVTLTARGISPNLRIVAKVTEETTERKLRMAGADAVVSPGFIGGLRMVSEMIRPTVTSFLDIMLRDEQGLRITEAAVGKTSRFVDRTLGELEIHKRMGAMVLAIKDGGTGKYIFNPGADVKLRKGDVLILLADVNQIEHIRELAEK